MSTLTKANLEGLPAGSTVEDGDGDVWVKVVDGRWMLSDPAYSYANTAVLASFAPITLVEAD